MPVLIASSVEVKVEDVFCPIEWYVNMFVSKA
jgi:hypothetical protein